MSGVRTSSSVRPAPSPRSSFLILRSETASARKSATAAALITTSAFGSSRSTASRISRAVSTSMRRTPAGVCWALGAAPSTTSPPRRTASAATAKPIFPEERLPT